jgi:hypothetical protein
MASPKKEWSKPTIGRLSEAEIQALAKQHESVRDLLAKRSKIRAAA